MLYSSIIIRISGPMPKPKCRRISTVCSRYSCAVWAGELCSLGTFCSFYSHLSSKTVFSALKLTQSCYYKYEHLFLLKNGNLIINWVPHKHTVPERQSSQSDKIWNQVDFKNLDFPTLKWIGKNFEVQF